MGFLTQSIILHIRRCRADRCSECPVLFPFRTFANPLCDGFNLFRCQRLIEAAGGMR